MSYDANRLPLGKLSKNTLTRGFQTLNDLAELLANPALADEKHNMTFSQAVDALSNSFYTIIPHIFGRSRPPTIYDDAKLKKEIELLESLSDMEIANEIMKGIDKDAGSGVHVLDRQFQQLGLEEMQPREDLNHATEPRGCMLNG